MTPNRFGTATAPVHLAHWARVYLVFRVINY